VECVVRDEGSGIPSWALDRIFDRGYRLPEARSQAEDSGIGLAICRRIVEEHGGRIRAESREGHGTTVRFTLPLAG